MRVKRKILASLGLNKKLQREEKTKLNVYSFFPIDRADCECRPLVSNWQKELASVNDSKRADMIKSKQFISCPKDKTGMERYEVTCQYCKSIQGYCWATDDTLTNWCDFHYVTSTNGEEWLGCLTPHVSPITEQLCLECTCGQDTRDFRANMTLPANQAYLIEEKNKIGREFGKSDSKFKTRIVGPNTVTFNY